jgi:hypothetical protein
MADDEGLVKSLPIVGDVAELVGDIFDFGKDWYYEEREADEQRARRKDAKEIALKRLALDREKMDLSEKDLAFQRLLKLMTGSSKMTERAGAVTRLKALRSA